MNETDIPVRTEAEALERATLDYLEAVGTVIEVNEISGYIADDSHVWQAITPEGAKPFRVRVLSTDNGSVYHWNDGYLDPLWDVEIVEGHANLPSEARSLWINAPRSYFVSSALAGGGAP